MSDPVRRVSANACVYGGYDGAVAFLDMPGGIIPPPYIADMVYLGDVASVVTRAIRAIEPPLQQALADHLGGVLQQSISRWSNGDNPPELTSSQWAKLVKLAIADQERVHS